ncbi:MAG: SnoaL-like domain protein [Gemmatimonadetes bacterium]|nr:SnoaL-like domain protein [Gemmatimonadota bacterium]
MSMRAWMIAVGVSALVTGCASASSETSGAQSLLATDREWSKLASTSKNADSVAAYWTEDARVVMPGQPVLAGRAAAREMVAGMLKVPGFNIVWKPDSAVVSRGGDIGFTYGTNELTVPDSTGKLVTMRGRYLTTWRKDADGRWRCTQEYSNPAPANS